MNSVSIKVLPSYLSSEVPETLNMEETENYTRRTYKELFASAVQANIPFYLVALVKTQFKGKVFCHAFDGVAFDRFFRKTIKEGKSFNNPINKLPVTSENIHLVAMKCFELNAKNKVINKGKISSFSPLITEDPSYKNRIVDEIPFRTFVINSLQFFNLEASDTDKKTIGELQYIVGCVLAENKEASIQKESLLWFRSALTNGMKEARDELKGKHHHH